MELLTSFINTILIFVSHVLHSFMYACMYVILLYQLINLKTITSGVCENFLVIYNTWVYLPQKIILWQSKVMKNSLPGELLTRSSENLKAVHHWKAYINIRGDSWKPWMPRALPSWDVQAAPQCEHLFTVWLVIVSTCRNWLCLFILMGNSPQKSLKFLFFQIYDLFFTTCGC